MPPFKMPTTIFIHHTGSLSQGNSGNPDQAIATNNYHKKKFGFISSLGFYSGYNYELSITGKITQFRQDGEQTAAQYQQNMNDGRALSICLDGNFDIEEPTQQQISAVAKWLKEKMAQYNIPKENVFCHRKVATYKSCPGKLLPDNIYNYFIPMEEETALEWAKKYFPQFTWSQEEAEKTRTVARQIIKWVREG